MLALLLNLFWLFLWLAAYAVILNIFGYYDNITPAFVFSGITVMLYAVLHDVRATANVRQLQVLDKAEIDAFLNGTIAAFIALGIDSYVR